MKQKDKTNRHQTEQNVQQTAGTYRDRGLRGRRRSRVLLRLRGSRRLQESQQREAWREERATGAKEGKRAQGPILVEVFRKPRRRAAGAAGEVGKRASSVQPEERGPAEEGGRVFLSPAAAEEEEAELVDQLSAAEVLQRRKIHDGHI